MLESRRSKEQELDTKSLAFTKETRRDQLRARARHPRGRAFGARDFYQDFVARMVGEVRFAADTVCDRTLTLCGRAYGSRDLYEDFLAKLCTINRCAWLEYHASDSSLFVSHVSQNSFLYLPYHVLHVVIPEITMLRCIYFFRL